MHTVTVKLGAHGNSYVHSRESFPKYPDWLCNLGHQKNIRPVLSCLGWLVTWNNRRQVQMANSSRSGPSPSPKYHSQTAGATMGALIATLVKKHANRSPGSLQGVGGTPYE